MRDQQVIKYADCKVTVPMGVLRAICGSRFRQGETEGTSKNFPDESFASFRCILKGSSRLVMPAALTLFVSSKEGSLVNILFTYKPTPDEICIDLVQQDIDDANSFIASHQHLITRPKRNKKGA